MRVQMVPVLVSEAVIFTREAGVHGRDWGGARLGRLGWALDAGFGGYGVVSDSDRVGEISCAEGFGVGSVDLWRW